MDLKNGVMPKVICAIAATDLGAASIILNSYVMAPAKFRQGQCVQIGPFPVINRVVNSSGHRHPCARL